MRFLALVLIAALPALASAQTSLRWNEDQISWTAPTQCADGSPIADCPTSGYRVETARSASGPWTLVTTTAANVLTHKVTGVAAGQNFYRVFTLSGTLSSDPTTPGSDTAVPPRPSPPTLLTIDVVAWEIRPNSSGALVASRIGIVPEGSVCSQETREVSGVTYNRIDTQSVDLVNWPNALKPIEAWARCG